MGGWGAAPAIQGAVELLGGPAWGGDSRRLDWLRLTRPLWPQLARPEIHIPGTFPAPGPGSILPEMSKIADKSGEMGCIVAEMSAIVDKSGQMVPARG